MTTSLKRIYASHWLIPVLSVVAIASLAMSTWVVVQFAHAQAQRERESVQADIEGCERGNRQARDVKAIGTASEELVRGIVDTVLPADATAGERRERNLVIRAQLEPLFDAHRAAIGAIEIIDCDTRKGS